MVNTVQISYSSNHIMYSADKVCFAWELYIYNFETTYYTTQAYKLVTRI